VATTLDSHAPSQDHWKAPIWKKLEEEGLSAQEAEHGGDSDGGESGDEMEMIRRKLENASEGVFKACSADGQGLKCPGELKNALGQLGEKVPELREFLKERTKEIVGMAMEEGEGAPLPFDAWQGDILGYIMEKMFGDGGGFSRSDDDDY
jgi:hypothetical protein